MDTPSFPARVATFIADTRALEGMSIIPFAAAITALQGPAADLDRGIARWSLSLPQDWDQQDAIMEAWDQLYKGVHSLHTASGPQLGTGMRDALTAAAQVEAAFAGIPQ